MLVNNEQAEQRINNPENLLRKREQDKFIRQNIRTKFPESPEDGCIIKPLHNGGRRPGDTNLDKDTRALIGAEAQLETLSRVAEKFGISEHHAHELGAGKVYTDAGVNKELVEGINKKLNEPHELAVQKLTETLLALTPLKISSVGKAKDLATIAGQLSRVAENTAPLKHEDEDAAMGAARIIVYSPTIKQENHYNSIEVDRPIAVGE